MAVKNAAYVNPENYLFLDQKRKLDLVKRIQKQIYGRDRIAYTFLKNPESPNFRQKFAINEFVLLKN